MNPLLLVHIGAGTVGIVTGAVSMMAPKGLRVHARAGNVFAAAIITMGVTGALVAVTRWLVAGQAYQVGNFLMGLFTAYLAVTGWMTGRRRVKEVGWQDGACLAVGALLAAGFVAAGAGTAAGAPWLQNGLGAPFFFVVGSVVVLAVCGGYSIARPPWSTWYSTAAETSMARVHGHADHSAVVLYWAGKSLAGVAGADAYQRCASSGNATFSNFLAREDARADFRQSKNRRSSAARRALAAATLKVTPRPGRSQTSMKPLLTIGLGRPSTMSYHQSGWPNGYSKAM